MDFIIALFIWLFGLDISDQAQLDHQTQQRQAPTTITTQVTPGPSEIAPLHQMKIPHRSRNHIIAVDDTHFRVEL
ncbi:MAG: hypothetical protein AAFW00_16220 [Bacteroidota bacterium]